MQCHAQELNDACTEEAVARDSFDYYPEAVAWREQQAMPRVGVSIDRRSLRRATAIFSDDTVYNLVGCVFAQPKTYTGLRACRTEASVPRPSTEIEYHAGDI